ncbi:MAG: LacI family DNA-binding transcriptional regulator, partial [Verrucomicrobiae bacterium]|nr:LacI family DNA-binding transcriptional regulator [Verrucomicrobiae bacterium]
MAAISIKDIAREAGVSVATVSRALNPKTRGSVHAETLEKVDELVEKYGYIPNRNAQSLARKSSETIGIVVPLAVDLVRSAYFHRVMVGIAEGLVPLPYDIKWIMVRDKDRKLVTLRELVHRHGVDGVIVISWRLLPRLIRDMDNHGQIPGVLFSDNDQKMRAPIVYCDEDSGVEKVCAFLSQRGHRRIGMVRGPDDMSTDASQRYDAFLRCAKKYDFVADKAFILETKRFEEEPAYRVMKGWLEEKPKLPDAFFCCNDEIARGVILALRERNLQVPGDVAIVGYDD